MTKELSNMYCYACTIYSGENQVFDTLLILQVFPLTNHVEVCNFNLLILS